LIEVSNTQDSKYLTKEILAIDRLDLRSRVKDIICLFLYSTTIYVIPRVVNASFLKDISGSSLCI